MEKKYFHSGNFSGILWFCSRNILTKKQISDYGDFYCYADFSPVKHRFISGSSKCTIKQLSSLLTKILTVIKTGLEKYCGIKISHTGVNNMWILKVDDYLEKSSLTGPESFMVVFSHEKEEDSVKK